MNDSDINNPKHWIRSELRALSAYHVQNAENYIKLDAMENPFVWPEELRAKWATLISQTDVNRYPDPSAEPLKQHLRQTMSIPDDMSVMLGNGSDEIIQIIAMTMAAPGKVILSAEPGFVMYQMIATFCGMKYVGVPLDKTDFSLDMPAMLQAMDEFHPSVVFLAYPNNPTGNLYSEQDVRRIIEAAPGLVVVDEAYAPFTDSTFMSALGEYDNLLVMRTVSKMGLAGLRLGLLAGPEAWLSEFEKLRLPYNINTLTQKSAAFALEHQDVFDQQTQIIREQRERMLSALDGLTGLTVYPSQANFILVRTAKDQAKKIHTGLKEEGILIKLMAGAVVLEDCLRITIGTEEENSQVIQALKKLL